MKTITVNATPKRVVKEVEVKKDLKWYCYDKRKMYEFVGGNLEFDYVYDDELKKKIIVPRPVELKYRESFMESNIDEIKDWANNNLNYSNAEVVSMYNDHVVFSVPDDEVEDFIDNLESQRFEFILG